MLSRFGGNLQNPSKKGLRIFRPSLPGYSFVQADQAGAEALVVSYLCPAGKFRELFLNGIKSHTYVAANIFTEKWIAQGHGEIARNVLKYPIPELKLRDDWKALAKHIKDNCDIEYFIGKKTCHSLNYRMAPPTFQEDVLKESEGEVFLPKRETERIHSIYHNTLFPEISQGWWADIENQVRRTGYLFNLFGFPCYCQGPYNDKTWRELTAWVPQSTVGCITAIAICDMQDYIEEHNLDDRWHILNDKHDSGLIECPDEDALECGRVFQGFLCQELTSPRGEKFRMKSEVSIGKNWAKWDKDTNPEGMKEVSLL